MKAQDILEVCVYVEDLDAAAAFYQNVMGLEILWREEGRHVFLRCGGRMLLIFNAAETTKLQDLPSHGTQGAGHICFAAKNEDLPAWRTHLAEHGVEIEHEATWGDRGQSLYFRDPDGNSLEVGTPRIWGIMEDDLSSTNTR